MEYRQSRPRRSTRWIAAAAFGLGCIFNTQAAEPAAGSGDFSGLRTLRAISSYDLSGRQELRLTSVDTPGWALPYDLGDAWRSSRSELSQATYRYSLGRLYGADFKLGLTASLPEYGSARRPAVGGPRNSYSALPMLHLGSESLLSERWRLSLSADSTLTEASGETEDFYVPGLTNAANIGLRYRF